MKIINEFNVIDFEAKRLEKTKEKEFRKRYEHIKSKCQIGDSELFDSLINEVEVTDEATHSLSDFIKACQRRGLQPTMLFEKSVLLHEDEFHEATGINWWIAIEEALTFFALLKEQDEDTYKQTIDLAVLPY